jgi:hypothetical protein
MVGAARFELTTPCPPGRCATKLRYAPNPLSKQFNENFKRGGILLESLPLWKYFSGEFRDNIELNQAFDTRASAVSFLTQHGL